MQDKFISLTTDLHRYLVERTDGRDEVLRRVEAETEALGPDAIMQIAPDQGAFMTLLVRVTGARRALELGTFTGYSAICIARGLPDDGRLLCCELNEEYAAMARANIAAAGVADRVEVAVGPAMQTLDGLDRDTRFDFAFIDADKPGYPAYYERVMELLEPGGLVLVDNVLFEGRVLEPDDEGTRAIAQLNDRIAADDRVECVMLGIADGLAIARKR